MTHSINRVDWSLAHVPQFVVAPKPRCAYRETGAAPMVCGAPATRRIAGVDWLAVPFRCAEHAGPDSQPITEPWLIRRVCISVDVLLCGVSAAAPSCHAEALARLEAAAIAIGAVLDVHGVTSRYGRVGPAPASGEPSAPADGAD